MSDRTVPPNPRSSSVGDRPVVVVATDGSDHAVAAATLAGRLVPDGAELHVVSVVPEAIDPDDGATGFAGPVVDEGTAIEIARSEQVAGDAATAATARALGPVPVRQEVLHGDPVTALAEHLDALDAQLLVVVASPTRAAPSVTSPTRRVDGVVAAELVDVAPCPILVIGEAAVARRAEPAPAPRPGGGS